MASSLQGKTALVTGASRGIGRATAIALADSGARVLVHYGRSAKDAESVVSDIRSKGGQADAIQSDLGTPEGAASLAKAVRSVIGERLDVLVLNAGITKAATIKDYTVEDFDNLFATNVRGPFFLVQQLLPFLGDARTSFSPPRSGHTSLLVQLIWKNLRFLLTPPRREQSRLSSRIGQPFSVRAVFASMP